MYAFERKKYKGKWVRNNQLWRKRILCPVNDYQILKLQRMIWMQCLLKAAWTSVEPWKPHCSLPSTAAFFFPSPCTSILKERTSVFLHQKILVLSSGLDSWKAVTCTAECVSGQNPSHWLFHAAKPALTQTHTNTASIILPFPILFLMFHFSPFLCQIYFYAL